MVVRLQVNNNDPGPYNSYQIGRSSGLQCNLDICEIIAFNSALSDEDADKVEGYLAQKWGLSGELEEVHPYKYLTPRSLSIQQTVTNGTDGASGMDGINKISLSSDGSQIIATSTNDNSLIYFNNSESGELSFGGQLNGGLSTPTSLVQSADGKFLYVASEGSNTINSYQTYLDPDKFTDQLVIWLDAKDDSTLLVNNSEIEQWNDKGPGSNHARAVGSDGPSLGNEAVLFSDSNYLMVDNDPLINLTAPAVFFVGRFSDKASSDEGDENSTLVSWAGYPGLSRGWRIYGNPSDYF